MDYFETLERLKVLPKIEQENEALKRRIAELEAGKPLTIESEVVNAYRQSEQYQRLESTAFMAFLQERFVTDFQRSPQGAQLMADAQAQFKIFERGYGEHAQGDSGPARPAAKARNGKDSPRGGDVAGD